MLVQKDTRNKSDKRFLSFTKLKNLLFLLPFCPYVFLPQNAVSVLVQKDARSKATKDFCHSQKQKTFCSFCLSVLMFSYRRMRFLCWHQRTQGQKRQKIFVIHKSKKPSVPSAFLSLCFPAAECGFYAGTKGHKEQKRQKIFIEFEIKKPSVPSVLLSFCTFHADVHADVHADFHAES